MEALSQEYGWTPEEIKRQSYSDIVYYLKILNTRRKLEEVEAKKAKR